MKESNLIVLPVANKIASIVVTISIFLVACGGDNNGESAINESEDGDETAELNETYKGIWSRTVNNFTEVVFLDLTRTDQNRIQWLYPESQSCDCNVDVLGDDTSGMLVSNSCSLVDLGNPWSGNCYNRNTIYDYFVLGGELTLVPQDGSAIDIERYTVAP